MSTVSHRRLGRNPRPRLVPILHYLRHCQFQCSPQLDLVIVVYGLSKLPGGPPLRSLGESRCAWIFPRRLSEALLQTYQLQVVSGRNFSRFLPHSRIDFALAF